MYRLPKFVTFFVLAGAAALFTAKIFSSAKVENRGRQRARGKAPS